MKILQSFFIKKKRISFNIKPKNTSWGGGNQFLKNLIQYLKSKNYEINFKLTSRTDLIFFINSKSLNQKDNNLTFNYDDLKKFKINYPQIKCIQRINDTDMHRKSNFIDKNFQLVNSLADYTIFVSDWVFKYHSNLWFDKVNKYKVINNDVDSEIFFPSNYNDSSNIDVYRVVTHHFSSNTNKGYDDYKNLDEDIYNKKIRNIELHIIGNVPKDIEWKSAKIHGLMHGRKLANFLRNCHIYITGSKYEASAMHWKEGVACGLPLIYSVKGGEIADYGAKYGLAFDGKNDMLKSINTIIKNYKSFRDNVRKNKSQYRMVSKYAEVIDQLIKE